MRDLDLKLLQELAKIVDEPTNEEVQPEVSQSETRSVRRTKK